MVDRLKAFLPKLHERGVLPADVDVRIAFDQSQYVRDALDNLREEAVLGAVLASLVVSVVPGQLAQHLDCGAVDSAVGAGCFGGAVFHRTHAQHHDAGGLALILGRVVDDSIVDVENTVRHLKLGASPARRRS